MRLASADPWLYLRIAGLYAQGVWGLLFTRRRTRRFVPAERDRSEVWLERIRLHEGR